MRVRTGIDLASVETMRGRIEGSGGDFAGVFLHDREREQVHENVRRITGRWAVKEATMKALGRGFGSIDPRDIQVLSDEDGRPVLHLYGNALGTAEELGLTDWDVSISYDGDLATAIVVAVANQ